MCYFELQESRKKFQLYFLRLKAVYAMWLFSFISASNMMKVVPNAWRFDSYIEYSLQQPLPLVPSGARAGCGSDMMYTVVQVSVLKFVWFHLSIILF